MPAEAPDTEAEAEAEADTEADTGELVVVQASFAR